MSFEPADAHSFYQKDNLLQAHTKVEEALTLIDETNLPWWRLWFIKVRLRKTSKYLSKCIDSIEVKDE